MKASFSEGVCGFDGFGFVLPFPLPEPEPEPEPDPEPEPEPLPEPSLDLILGVVADSDSENSPVPTSFFAAILTLYVYAVYVNGFFIFGIAAVFYYVACNRFVGRFFP